MDEPDTLGRLLECLSRQHYTRFRLYACVNQPDAWHHVPQKSTVCRHNAESLQLLSREHGFPVTVIDRTSQGRGWTGGRHGVGYARKAVMDRILHDAGGPEVIVSLDADTVFGEEYLGSVARNFHRHPRAVAMSVPYFHPVPEDPSAARAILRYEIYMRHYFLNMARVGSPYTFTALGSAMAVRATACRAIGGITPKMSGEDFYFLQKLRKYGSLLLWNDEPVYPEARFSDRVFFGTGPAMIRGAEGDWSSYPIYPVELFDEVGDTYRMLPEIYRKTPDNAVTRFLAEVFREADPFHPLRVNHTSYPRFVRAFHEKFDGLRILQFLKTAFGNRPVADEESLLEYLDRFYPGNATILMGDVPAGFRFGTASAEDLDRIRKFLYEKEMQVRFTAALP